MKRYGDALLEKTLLWIKQALTYTLIDISLIHLNMQEIPSFSGGLQANASSSLLPATCFCQRYRFH